jgi:hypothetical protein
VKLGLISIKEFLPGILSAEQPLRMFLIRAGDTGNLFFVFVKNYHLPKKSASVVIRFPCIGARFTGLGS